MTARRTLRNLYQRIFNREYWRHREAQKNLFRQFIKPDALAFDIGANRGEVSETFLDLDARVVAVEPNPVLAEEIRRHLGSKVRVESVAVGAEEGQAELSLGLDSGHSTLSKEWIERAPTGERWHGSISTDVTTLDALIQRYGVPDFVKIDVEAYEAEALAGLSTRLKALCFEYQGAYTEVAEQCVALLGDGYEYALTHAEEPALTTAWSSSREVLERLRSLGDDEYGDIFARRVGT